MTLGINTNLAALDAQRHQGRAQADLAASLARLSSGLRINSASDDAAGLAIADRFSAQIRGTTQAGRNANDGISLAQTADGALASIGANLQRIRELSVQAANATNSASDRASLQLEVTQLQSEIDRVATQTQFNGNRLLDGSFGAQSFQVGGNSGQTIATGALPDARASSLGVYRGFAATGIGLGTATNVPLPYGVAVGSAPVIPLGSLNCEAKSFVDALNNARVDGLRAVADATVASGVSSAAASAAGTASVTINGVVVALAGQAGAAALASNRVAAVAALNAQSAATGVRAADNGSGLTLTAADGRNVTLQYGAGSFTGSGLADFGLTTTPVSGATYSVYYTQPAGVSGDFSFIQSPFTTPTSTLYAVGSTGPSVAAIDLLAAGGAGAALDAVDRALATVDAARASLGASQNRFASTLGDLQTAGENLSASRSRIQDADFAAETATLSRAQVLQQVGTAMIAQANQSPGQVLALLRSG